MLREPKKDKENGLNSRAEKNVLYFLSLLKQDEYLQTHFISGKDLGETMKYWEQSLDSFRSPNDYFLK